MGHFHPHADELHGFTVCITCNTGETWIGRWQQEEQGKIFLLDVAYHREDESESTRDEFIKQCATWGINVTQPHATVERGTVENVRKLGELASEIRGW